MGKKRRAFALLSAAQRLWIAATIDATPLTANSIAVLTLTQGAPSAAACPARRLHGLRGRGEQPARMSQPGTMNAVTRLATEQVAFMKHHSTRAVFEYWDKKRGARPAPARAEIDPAEIRHALGDTFMLSADFADQLRFRLAGTRVCALFAREIKGEAFNALWDETTRQSIEDVLASVTHKSAGAIAGVTASTEDGSKADLELLLLPLAHAGHARIRALGVLAPMVTPYWIGTRPITELVLGTVRHIGDGIENHPAPRLVPAAEDVRVRHGFVVFSGGRETSSGERTG